MNQPTRATLEQAENKAREIGRKIKSQLPPGWGFVLTLASFGEGTDSQAKAMTYVSNCDRECAVKLLRELADKVERSEKQL